LTVGIISQISTIRASIAFEDASLKDEVDRHWKEIMKHTYEFDNQQEQVYRYTLCTPWSSIANRLRYIIIFNLACLYTPYGTLNTLLTYYLCLNVHSGV